MNAAQLHKQAEQARESGDFLGTHHLADQAFAAYLAEGKKGQAADALDTKVITYRHQFQETDDQAFLIIAKHTAMAAIEIAESTGDPTALALPHIRMGMVYEDMNNWQSASEHYQKAVEHMEKHPPEVHHLPSVLADMKVHLAVAQYRAGNASALGKAEQAVKDLAGSGNPNRYSHDVWHAGGHMRLAKALKETDPDKAKGHLAKAKKIIDANPNLALRKKQLAKLEVDLNL